MMFSWSQTQLSWIVISLWHHRPTNKNHGIKSYIIISEFLYFPGAIGFPMKGLVKRDQQISFALVLFRKWTKSVNIRSGVLEILWIYWTASVQNGEWWTNQPDLSRDPPHLAQTIILIHVYSIGRFWPRMWSLIVIEYSVGLWRSNLTLGLIAFICWEM